MTMLTFDTVAGWLRTRGDGMYGGEAISQLEHALQCAALAEEEGASPALVAAALLHDIGHLSDNADDCKQPHEELGATMLSGIFPRAVTEPIRLHVAAKRYLCAIDPLYWSGLSPQSKRSLEWQGGPFSPREAVDFITQDYAEDAVRLRHWDDTAKVQGKATPQLDYFIPKAWELALEAEQA